MKKNLFKKKTEDLILQLHLKFIKKILVFDSVDSTNVIAKDLAQSGVNEGTVVIAKTQQKGRGRFDRIWQSPEGGLYMSVVFRPAAQPEHLSLLPLVAAVSVAKSIDSYGVLATIKWPNDVRVNGKKIAGILLETEGKNKMVDSVIVGIGINLNIHTAQLSSEIQKHSTSLQEEIGHPIDYHEFLTTLLAQLDRYYGEFVDNHYAQIIEEWKTASDTIGKIIHVQTATETLKGIAYSVDQHGFLLLKTETGELKKILSGDCLYFDEL